MYEICQYTGTCVLRSPGCLPCEVSLGGERTRQVNIKYHFIRDTQFHYGQITSGYYFIYLFIHFYSGEGSHQSGCSEDRTPGAMARAITVHADTKRVMYFA